MDMKHKVILRKVRVYRYYKAGLYGFDYSEFIGTVLVIDNRQRLNRDTKVFYAERTQYGYKESVFYLVRQKDANLLKGAGFEIEECIIPKDCYPVKLTNKILKYGFI